MKNENLLLFPVPQEITYLNGFSNFETFIFNDEKFNKILSIVDLQNISFNKNNNVFISHIDYLKKDEYILKILNNFIEINYTSDSGLFYALISLKHLNTFYKNAIPNLYIRDFPSLEIRGVLLDISRDKIPKLDTFYKIIDILADIKINHFQLYIEGYSFEYKSFQHLWENKETPITIEEIQQLQKYCKDRFIDLVGNQNCFGHMDSWLQEPEYKHLAENFDGVKVQGGLHTSSGTTLNPLDPSSLELVKKIFDNIVPYFESEYFNTNLDEPYELGTGKTKNLANKIGVGKIYLDYVLKIYEDIKKRNKRMMMWGDIIIKNPEISDLFPKDIIMLEWGYTKYHPFDSHCKIFKENGYEFLVCPGTTSWGAVTGRTDNMLLNIYSAAKAAMKYTAKGLLNTEWGNAGHMQTPAMSYPGHVFAGALSWNINSHNLILFENYLNCIVYKDTTNKIASIILDYGRYRQFEDIERETRTMAVTTYERGIEDVDIIKEYLEIFEKLTEEDKSKEEHLVLIKTLESLKAFEKEKLLSFLKENEQKLIDTHMQRLDTDDIISQYLVAGQIIKAGTLGRYYLLNKNSLNLIEKKNLLNETLKIIDEFIPQYKENWLKENKNGGLHRSISLFNNLKIQVENELNILK